MDIKMEPDDDLLSSHGTSGFDNDAEMNVDILSEGHSIGDGFDVRVKQEEFDEDDFNKEGNAFVMESQKIKKENEESWEKYKKEYYDDVRSIKVEKIDVGECSYAVRKQEKPQTTNTKSKDPIKPPAINSSQFILYSTSNISRVHIKKEFSLQEVNVVIQLKTSVFYERNFVCSICYNTFPSSHLLKQHATFHGNRANLDTNFSAEPDVKNNMNDICNEDYSIDIKHEALEVHHEIIEQEKHHQSKKTKLKLHSQKKPNKRDQCSLRTAACGRLKMHNRSHTKEKPFKCEQCSFRTAASGSLKKHKMLHTGEKPFKCDQCSYRTTESGSLKTHKRSHTGEKPFECDKCSYRTAQSCHLKTHKMSHTGEKPFKCDQCSYRTTESGDLKKHKMSHSGEKPFECDQCSFRTATSGNLKTHKMSHTGEKPFKCDQCNFKATRSCDLKRHKMSHTGEKPFKCDQCAYRTAERCNLKTHKLSHTGEKPFKCHQCSFRTATSGNLKRHKMSHTEEKASK